MATTQRRSQRIAESESEVQIVDDVELKKPAQKAASKVTKPASKKAAPKTVTTQKPVKKSGITKIKSVISVEDEPVKSAKPSKHQEADLPKTFTADKKRGVQSENDDRAKAGTAVRRAALATDSKIASPASRPASKTAKTLPKAAKPLAKSAVAVVRKSKVATKSQNENSEVGAIVNTTTNEPVVISEELEVGDRFPTGVTVTNQNEEEVDLSKVIEDNRVVIIFAYPKASTPGCTRQANGFKDKYPALMSHQGVTIFGLSADGPRAQKRFQEKYGLPYDLIADTGRELIELFGIGKQPKGIIRSHLIFVGGKLAVKRVKVSPEDSFNSAAAYVAEL